jgi:2-polyprenyl-3-methyl-5-hydroxy-6-metoxy-1,4-benzoquinol methylase
MKKRYDIEAVDTYTKVRFEKYMELINDKTGKLLDIGCGKGTLASFLDNRYDYYGVDISLEVLKVAKQKGLKVICCDLDQGIPFKNEIFDIAVAGEVIEHLPNVSNFLKVWRVLKSDGIFVGSTPNASNLTYLLKQFLNPMLAEREKLGGHLGHLYVFDRSQLKALFEINGFEIVKFTGTTLLPISKITLPLNKWLGEKFSYFSTGLVFKARKRPRRDEKHEAHSSYSF